MLHAKPFVIRTLQRARIGIEDNPVRPVSNGVRIHLESALHGIESHLANGRFISPAVRDHISPEWLELRKESAVARVDHHVASRV